MKAFANASCTYNRFATQNMSAFCFCALLIMGIAAAISIFAFFGLFDLFITAIAISVILLSVMTVIIVRKNRISCNCLIQHL